MSAAVTERALLVPMRVEALVVSDDPRKVVNLAPRLGLFGRVRLGGLLKAEPWVRATDLTLAPGVHLHWQLPAALTHGIQTRGGEIEFPAVPNRWLVLRVAGDGSSTPLTRAWVVRSDELGPQSTIDTVVREGAAYVARKIGRAYRYDEHWQDVPIPPGAPATTALTAVGPGNLTFAAFYPGCRNVFGFHDDLAAVDGATLLYLVVGWYARPEDDPLGPDTGQVGRAERRRDLEAQWLERSSIPKPWPSRTVCHGTVHGVARRQADARGAANLDGARFKIAVGNTAVEALAALVAAPAESGPSWEPLVAAFQYDVLANMDGARGLPEIDAELHRRRFRSVEGGTEWTIRRIEHPAGATTEPDRLSKPAFPPDPEVAAGFNDLAEAQREHDELGRRLVSLREEYYAAWYRKALPDSPDGQALSQRLQTLERDIRTTDGDLGKKRQAIRDLCQQLQAKRIRVPEGAADGTPPDRPEYELVATPMPWFWQPNDPAILLARPGDPAAHRYERADGTRGLACRVLDQVVSGMTATLSGRDVTVTMPPWRLSLPTRPDAPALPFAVEIAALFRESLFLDPARAEAMARSAYEQIGSRQVADSPLVTELKAGIVTAQQDRETSGPVRRVGALPESAMTPWRPAWDPLFVVWEIEWASSTEDIPRLDVTGQWELRDNTDYRWRAGTGGPGQATRSYRGWAPLSLSLSRQLRERLSGAAGDAAGGFAAWTLMTQSAAGFTDALIMREETLQFPPLAPGGAVDESVRSLLGEGARWSPLGADQGGRAGFYPVRAGHMRITRLVLVDAFGQAQTVIGDPAASPRPVLVADSLRGPDAEAAPWIALPPRIAQPARLLARWVSVADERQSRYRESNANPATGPILGWIVPDHLDRSLLVCDGQGRIRGAVQRAGSNAIWSAVPGSGEDWSAERSLVDAFHLRLFVDGLVRRGSRALEDLLDLIDRISLCITAPTVQESRGLEMIIGQPLALARASLALEGWGRLATDQRTTDSGLEGTGGIAAVRFPVRLGDVRRSGDGLIGYFTGADYSRIRPAFGAPAPRNADDYFALDPDIAVSLHGAPAPVTLLMDPRAGVHITPGIVPTALLELPGHFVTEALQVMEPSVQVAPVLGVADALRLPVPEDLGGSWIWVDRDRGRLPSWQANPEVGKPETRPGVPTRPLGILEGWLSYRRAEPKPR